MSDERNDRIRQRARDIWEHEGRPHGRHEVHWRQAEREVRDEGEVASPGAGAVPLRDAPMAEPEASRKAAAGPETDRPARRRESVESAGGLPTEAAETTGSDDAEAFRGGPQQGAVDPGGPGLGSREDLG